MFVQCFQICMLTCSHGLQCCSSILCWHQKMSFLYSGTQRLFSSLNCNRSVTDARIPHIVSRFIVQGYCQSKCIKRPSLDSSWYSLQNCIKIWPCFCVTYCTHSSSAILYTLTKEGRKGKDMIFVSQNRCKLLAPPHIGPTRLTCFWLFWLKQSSYK